MDFFDSAMELGPTLEDYNIYLLFINYFFHIRPPPSSLPESGHFLEWRLFYT